MDSKILLLMARVLPNGDLVTSISVLSKTTKQSKKLLTAFFI